MLDPSMYSNGEIVAMDREYINYEKFEELTERNVVYVTKLKKNLVYETLEDCMDMEPSGKMQYREHVVVFRKGEINHIDRIVTYVDIKKGRQPKLTTINIAKLLIFKVLGQVSCGLADSNNLEHNCINATGAKA